MADNYGSLEDQKLVNIEPTNEDMFDIYQVDEVELALERDFYIVGNNRVTNSDSAFEIFKQFWNTNLLNIQEQMTVMLLNQSNKVIGMYQHSKGAINATVADKQLVAAVAIKSLAKGVIIAHNHPSGNLQPSESDIKLTKTLAEGLKLFDIILIDSLIITSDTKEYRSLANDGYLEDGGEIYYNDDIDDFDRGGEVKEFNVMYFQKVATRDGSMTERMRDRDVISGSLETVLGKAFNNFTMVDNRAMIVDRNSGANVANINKDGTGYVNKEGYGLNVGEIELEKEVEIEEVKPERKKLFGLFAEGGMMADGGDKDKMAIGGATFEEKVKSVKSSLLKRKKVSPKVQKDYGKTYSPKEAEASAKRIVGAMTAGERLKARLKKRKK